MASNLANLISFHMKDYIYIRFRLRVTLSHLGIHKINPDFCQLSGMVK